MHIGIGGNAATLRAVDEAVVAEKREAYGRA
jgi:hypothetical protein